VRGAHVPGLGSRNIPMWVDEVVARLLDVIDFS